MDSRTVLAVAGAAAVAFTEAIPFAQAAVFTVRNTAADRNLVSGNLGHGISIMNSNAVANVVQGNFIGLNSTGDTSEFGPVGQATNMVELRITRIQLDPDAVRLTFPSSPQQRYTLEHASRLGQDAVWQSVAGAEEIRGTGGLLTLLDPMTPSLPMRFYRLRLL